MCEIPRMLFGFSPANTYITTLSVQSFHVGNTISRLLYFSLYVYFLLALFPPLKNVTCNLPTELVNCSENITHRI